MSGEMGPDRLMERYRRLQRYVRWTDEDAERVSKLLPLAEPSFDALVDDFYETIETEPGAAKIIVGGPQQVARLKQTLSLWLRELFSGNYDADYVVRRWRVGWKHVEIGLESAFYNVAMARLRSELIRSISHRWSGSPAALSQSMDSLHRLLDLDAAVIQDAYEAEYVSRQRDAERKRSEQAFKRLVEAAGSLIMILREDRTIAYFNPFAEKLTGYAASAVTNAEYTGQFFPNEYTNVVREEVNKVFTGSPARGFECPIVCRDGSQRWVVWNVQWMEDFSGSPVALAMGQDVTEQRIAVERALQSERLAAIGQTVAGLAHESRNAFQRSQACLELLELELAGRLDELELVARIQRALNHLHRLYEEVREYAAPINLDYQSCDLAQLWRDAWMHLEVIRHDKQIQLHEEISGVDLKCVVDWFAIGQVFRNVLENAIAACGEHGEIRVRCRAWADDGVDWVQIGINDSGPGIDPAVADKVFEAFFTTRNKGTGLGMAITRRIVEAHGGSIALGDPDQGAEFIITLPRQKTP